MSENVEAEVRRLLRKLSTAAALCGGMDAATYEALMPASAALSSDGALESQSARSAALSAAHARLEACEAEPHAKAA